MDKDNERDEDYQIVFSKNAMEFATVAREYCVFAENAMRYSKADYLKVASRLLPLLYMKGAMLPDTERASDDELAEIVDFQTYETVRQGIADRLTSHDDYLTTFKEDFKYSETPVAASISEDMADIYQDIRNFCEQYHCGDNATMNDALASVTEKFRAYWGARALSANEAIHAALYSGEDLSDEAPAQRDDLTESMLGDLLDDDEASNEETITASEDGMPYFLRQNGMRLVGNKK